jgi:hypothetical protein
MLTLLRETYPLLTICVVWSELGLRHPFIANTVHDQLVAQAELSLFGLHPHAVWIRAAASPLITELMRAIYVLYYPLLLGVPAAILLAGRSERTERMVLRMALGYLTCFAIYFLFPVDGPMDALPGTIVRAAPSGLGTLIDGIRSAGDSLGTAFPSSHVVGCITLAWIAWESGLIWLRWPALVAAIGVPPATVYTQNHYALDAVLGVALGLLLHGWIAPALIGLGRMARKPGLLPTPSPRTADEAES